MEDLRKMIRRQSSIFLINKMSSVLGTRKLPHLTTYGPCAKWKKDKLWTKLLKVKRLKHEKGSLVLKQDSLSITKIQCYGKIMEKNSYHLKDRGS